MKFCISRKNGQLKMKATADNVHLLVKLITLLLDIRLLDRLRFVRTLTKLLINTVLLVINLVNDAYTPFVVPITKIVCKKILKQGPPQQCFIERMIELSQSNIIPTQTLT